MVVPAPRGFFSETPPFRSIYSVQWNTYRLVMWLARQDGVVDYTVQFTEPHLVADSPPGVTEFRPYYTLGELKSLADKGRKVKPPVFGKKIVIEQETYSFSGNWPYSNSITNVVGDLLYNNPPTGFPDSRGYTSLQRYSVLVDDSRGGIPLVFPEAADKLYFDYSGQLVKLKDVPEFPEKGWALVSDPVGTKPAEKGTVYVLLNHGPEDTRGLTKYRDSDSKVLWKITDANRSDTVWYDEDLGVMGVVDLSFDFGRPAVTKYNARTGKQISRVVIPEGRVGEDCTRNGIILATTGVSDAGVGDIEIYDRNGTLLRRVAGGDLTDWFWGGLTCYGEDYFVVVILKNGDHVPTGGMPYQDETTITLFGYRIYDIHTGAMVSEVLTPNRTSVTGYYQIGDITFDPLSIFWHFFYSFNQPSYGNVGAPSRSEYWP